MTEELVVYLNGNIVGYLFKFQGKLSFRYAEDYLATARATAISLSMPLTEKKYAHEKVEPFLYGLLPDNRETLQEWGRPFGINANNVFGLIEKYGKDCAGAIQFFHPTEKIDQKNVLGVSPLESDPLTDNDIADHIRKLKNRNSNWNIKSGKFSLAGAQTKFSLRYLDDTWFPASASSPSTHIFKPSINDLTDFDLVEHLMLATATKSGLPAASSKISEFEDQRVLIVERFDRRIKLVTNAESKIFRVHKEDLCQALGTYPFQKYQSDGGPTPFQISELFRKAMTPLKARQAIEFFVKALVFSWLTGNSDAHAKNYSIIHTSQTSSIAPAYDLGSIFPYEQHKIKLAMKIGGEYKINFVTKQNWEGLSEETGIDKETTFSYIEELTSLIPVMLNKSVADLPMIYQESAIVEKLLSEISKNIKHLRI